MTKLTRRAVVAGMAGLAATGARAEAEWPARTITIIHGFAAGGPSDVVGRLVADGLSRALGVSVIVEPRPGASGTTAAAQIARANPDGYTLGVIPSGHASAVATFAHLPFKGVDDFTTITLCSDYPYLMATNADSGIKTVAELINAAKTRSTPLLFGTPGVGSGPQLAIELFGLKTGLKFQHIPFKGSEPAATELVAGRLDFMMDPPSSLIGFVRAGRLNALAVSSAKHYFALPDTPTVAESGFPGFNVSAWQGLIGPAGLPTPIVKRLNEETVRILKAPETKERMHGFGNEPAPTTPEEFRQRLTDDIALWTDVADQIHFEKI
jgi:tripartite-type tricarboxylate transporter receptor subunit TctC